MKEITENLSVFMQMCGGTYTLVSIAASNFIDTIFP